MESFSKKRNDEILFDILCLGDLIQNSKLSFVFPPNKFRDGADPESSREVVRGGIKTTASCFAALIQYKSQSSFKLKSRN